MFVPSALGATRSWIRSTSIGPMTGNRNYFEIPQQDRPELPFTVHYRYGGTVDDQWMDHPDMSFECWGENKKAAEDLAIALVGELITLDQGRHLVIDGVRYCGATLNIGPVPNPSPSWAKVFRVDATLHMRLV